MTLYAYQCPQCPSRVSLSILGVSPCCLGAAHAGKPVVMEVLPDDAKALLPLSPAGNAGLVPLKVEHLKAAGIHLPETQHALEWLYRHRSRNGYAEVFTKVQGRVCMDLVAFAKITRERRP